MVSGGDELSAGTAARICAICRQDCSNKPRSRDAKGRYYCKACLEKVAAQRRRDAQRPAAQSSVAPDAGAYQLEGVSPRRSAALAAPAAVAAEPVRCGSCGQLLAPGEVICIPCGINAKTGRPLITAAEGNVERIRENARALIWFASWPTIFAFAPVSSEAHGTSKPYVIRTIAIVTIAFSLFVLLFEATGASPMRTLKSLYLWAGQAQPEAEHLESLYQYSEWGDRRAFQRMKTELESTTPQAELALAAHQALQPSQRAIGVFHWWQLLTHALLHGGVFHLVGNLVFLLIFGSRINALIGNLGTLIVYPILAVAAAVPQMIAMQPGPPAPMVGASGAIAGLAGMYLVFFPNIRVHMAIWLNIPMLLAAIFVTFLLRAAFAAADVRAAGGIASLLILIGIFRWRSFWVLLLFFGWDAVDIIRNADDGVAHWAHLGGFAAGIVIALGLMIGRGVNPRGSDILSMTLGPRAWPIIGKPSQWRGSAYPEGWLGSLRLIPAGALENLSNSLARR